MSKSLVNLIPQLAGEEWINLKIKTYSFKETVADNLALSQLNASQALSIIFKELHFQIRTFSNLKIVEDIGVEPMTLCVQGRCSSQLS